VTTTNFYAESAGPDGKVTQIETTRVPYIVDTSCYRWTIAFTAGQGDRQFTERFTLPDSASSWGDTEGEATTVSRDRRVAVTKVFADLSEGLVTHGWCVAAGDPLGQYRIEVFDGKRLLKRFDFKVVLPAEAAV